MLVKDQIGANVRRLRRARGMYQHHLARSARISLETLSNVENGKQNVRVDTLERLATALGVAPGDLLAPITGRKS